MRHQGEQQQVGAQLNEAIGRQRDECHREQARGPGRTACTPEQRPGECQDDCNHQDVEDPKSRETQALEQFEEQHQLLVELLEQLELVLARLAGK